MITASVLISRVLLLGVAPLAAFATNTLADTAVVTFDAGTVPSNLDCNETWFEGDIGLSVVPTPAETCGSLCVITHSDGILGLQARLRADLSLISGPIDSVEVTLSTVCFDCVEISVFNGDELVATTTNGSVAFPPATITLEVGSVHADRLEIIPCVDLTIFEIVVHFEPSATSVVDRDFVTPNRHAALGAMHPNPFNPSISIPILVAESGRADLRVYGPSGRQVRSLFASDLPAGRHQIVWDGVDDEGLALTSGVYFVQLRFDGVVADTRKAILVQ
jgi:hypothetical protein